jgi:peptide/nickel transport system substrate-binding protein
MLQAGISTLAPGAPNADALSPLVFDTLVSEDANGNLQPGLATSWTHDAGFTRWQFWVRREVRFHNGDPLTPEIAAASLGPLLTGCKVSSVGDSIVAQCEHPEPALASRLALPFAAIIRSAGEKPDGTGPFVVKQFEPGKHILLAAFEDYWGGRPYIDAIDIQLGSSARDEALALELGHADLADAPDTNRRRASTTEPSRLMAMVFSASSVNVSNERVRHALSLVIDRATIADVLLQKAAHPAAGILPNWISGYEFLFAEPHDETRARQLRSDAHFSASISLAVAQPDAQLRLVAERIALNARDAGFNLQLTADSQRADAVLTMISLRSRDPEAALADVAARLQKPAPPFSDASLEAAFLGEREMLKAYYIVPVAHTSAVWGTGPRLRNWSGGLGSAVRVADVWLAPEAAGEARR